MTVSVFWNAKGIALIDFLQKIKTINGEYYANLLRQLQEAINSKQPGKLAKGVPFHQNNVLGHKSVIAMSFEHDCGFELINHPTYSPDLVQSDNVKKYLVGNRYRTDCDVISDVEDFLGG